MIGQRTAARRHEVDILREQHGQILIRNGDDVIAVIHDRDGAAPVALPADQPVMQAVVDGFLALAGRLQPIDHAVDGRILAPFGIGAHAAVHGIGIDHDTGSVVGSRHRVDG